MSKLIVIDGNSILNRAFYGIMGNKMLQTADGTYTNAVYGFLNIMFKILDEEQPKYLAVAFDVKHPTKRHEMFAEYKGTRKGMPEELATQMPIIKKVLKTMNITILEKPGYEADDILGTLATSAEKNGIDTILLTGDRDSFQLASDKITIKIPRTKQGKTETESFDKSKIIETYGILPKQLIEVKGLMGDASDNIPGVPGIGEKTALNLIKNFETIDNIYERLKQGDSGLKGKVKENLENNEESAYLSRTLGTIDIEAPIEKNIEQFEIKEWNKEEVLKIFKELRFNRFIERFNLESNVVENKTQENLFEHKEIVNKQDIENLIQKIKDNKKLYYFLETADAQKDFLIIKKEIKYINIYIKEENTVYTVTFDEELFKEFFVVAIKNS